MPFSAEVNSGIEKKNIFWQNHISKIFINFHMAATFIVFITLFEIMISDCRLHSLE